MPTSDLPAAGPSRRLVAAVVVSIGAFLLAARFTRVNHTPSVPPGLYLTVPAAWTDPPDVGDLVVACAPDGARVDSALARGYLPPSGDCASGALPLLKRVLAAEGQAVRHDSAGLAVDGDVVRAPSPTTDSRGRAIAPAYGTWTLGPGEVWLASDIERGFDSRYLGPFGAELVTDRATRLVPF